jgi:hypothetical protein
VYDSSIKKQPNARIGFTDQTSVTFGLFNFILDTTQTREQLENSWEIIAQDIVENEQRELVVR